MSASDIETTFHSFAPFGFVLVERGVGHGSLSTLEYVEGQKGGDDHIGHVDDLADLQIDRDACEAIGLFAAQAVGVGDVVQHIEQRVAGRRRNVFGFIAPVAPNRKPGRRVEAAGHRSFRPHEIVVAREGWIVLPAAGSFALQYFEIAPRRWRTFRWPSRTIRRHLVQSARRRRKTGRPPPRPGGRALSPRRFA